MQKVHRVHYSQRLGGYTGRSSRGPTALARRASWLVSVGQGTHSRTPPDYLGADVLQNSTSLLRLQVSFSLEPRCVDFFL